MFDIFKKSEFDKKIDGKENEIKKLNKRKEEVRSIIFSYSNINFEITSSNRNISIAADNLEDGLKGDGVKNNASVIITEKETDTTSDTLINSAIENLEQEIKEIDRKIQDLNNNISDLKDEEERKENEK